MSTPTHHYSERYRLRAVCGQVADGVNHTNESAPILRAMVDLGHFEVCSTCLATLDEQAPHD
ncbi:hypothetical protein JCM18899A_13800 [Nocardioides sp. AN3]